MMKDQRFPNTIRTLEADFRKLGLEEGMTVIVHSSLKSLGWVCGGPAAVVQALMNTVGEEGTLVMPTHSGELSEPSYWELPPVPEEWWQIIRDEMPPFDPKTTPTRMMGKIVDSFLAFEGTVRSYHPVSSFAAWGKHKDYITTQHSLEYSFGEGSPLQKIYNLDGHVLLLGVPYNNNTSLHLAECYAESCYTCEHGSPIIEEGKRVWKTYVDFIYDIEHFDEIGAEFERKHEVHKGHVGMANCRLMNQRQLVDFAVEWLKQRKEDWQSGS